MDGISPPSVFASSHPVARRITVIYAGVALLWILATDFAVEGWFIKLETGHRLIHFAQGMLFVAISAGVLHALVRWGLERLGRAEATIREREQYLRLALAASGDAVWEVDLTTGRAVFPAEWLAKLGLAEAEIDGRWANWLARVHLEDRPHVERALAEHVADPSGNYCCEFRTGTKEGEWRWILSRGRIVDFDAAGNARRMLGTHTDITTRKQAEQEALESADRYRDLFEANPNPMWIYNPETFAMLAVNDVAIRRYGYSREEFLAMTVFDLRPPEDAERFRACVQERGLAPQIAGLWRHRLADGTIILAEVTSQPLRWQGCPARVVMARDVTQQEAARRELAENQRKFSAIFQSANDAIFIASSHTRITDCNERALELFRATGEQMIGQRVSKFFPPKQPDGSDSVSAALRVLQAARQHRLAPIEWTLRRPDGTCFECEVTVSPLRVSGNEGYVLVVRDLTERRKAVQQLQLLHAALRATPTGCLITDHEGRIEWVNPAFTRLSGYSAEEVMGRNPRMLNSGLHSREFYAALWATISRGEVWSGEVRNKRRDGTIYDEQMVIAPVRDGLGAITHYVALKHDITVERSLEQQLSRAQRLESIGMLASGIAHDLNNVLTPILLCTEFLKLDFPTEAAAAKFNLIAQAAQRGAGIVRQVLTFARGVEGERTVLDPTLVLKEIGQLARETLPRNIEVSIEGVRQEGLLIEGDVTQMHQALLNLVVNARDAMPFGGKLTLRRTDVQLDELRARRNAIAPGRYVELAVMDTGTGIPEEALEKIFDPFFSTKPRGKGTGLGLSTVYGIVRGHGGAVEVSTQWGSGSTFALLLPALANPALGERQNGAPVHLQGEGRWMLVVDDEEAIRQLVAHILRRRGFVVVEACDGAEGLARFRSRPGKWAGAVTDMMMPRMDGMALSLELRAIDPTLPIIGMSGMIDDPDATEAGSVKIDPSVLSAMLPKPFCEQELLAALAGALGER